MLSAFLGALSHLYFRMIPGICQVPNLVYREIGPQKDGLWDIAFPSMLRSRFFPVDSVRHPSTAPTR